MLLPFLTPKIQELYPIKVSCYQTQQYTTPTLLLLRHHQHDTHEAWGIEA